MKAWMLSVVGRALDFLGQRRPAPRPSRGRRPGRVSFEGLERREVLAGGPGVIPFATLVGQVSSPGQPTQVVLHLAADELTSARMKPVLIGFYATPADGSALNPAITEVDGPRGPLGALVLPKRAMAPPIKNVFLTQVLPVAGQAEDITVNVAGLDASVGPVVVRAFLPGDVNGDGTVDGTDLSRVQAAYGSALGQPRYDAPADFNGDGHIGCIDRRLTQLNQGAHVAAAPFAAAAAPVAAAAAPVAPAPVVFAAPAQTATLVATPVQAASIVLAPTQAQAPTVTYGQATPAGSAVVYGQPVVSLPTVNYGQAATTTTTATGTTATPTYLYAQPATVAYGQPTPAGTTYAYGQPVIQAPAVSPGQATTPAPGTTYVVYQPMAQAPAQVPTQTLSNAPVYTSTAVPAPSPSPLTMPIATGYLPGESGPVYVYGQSVVQAPAMNRGVSR